MSSKKKIQLVLIVAIILFLGFYRDFLFKSINALLKAWDNDMDYQMSYGLGFMENMEYDSIVNLKWFLTLLFTGIYLLVSIWTIRIFFPEKKFIRITAFAYLLILILSACFIAAGKILPGTEEKMYEYARYLMGMAQSPVILMILVPVFKLSLRERSKESN